MVCETCKAAARQSENLTLTEALALHEKCKGGTHCDCQHIPTLPRDNGSRAQRRQ